MLKLPNDDRAIAMAQSEYNDDGRIEIDDTAIVSRGSELGAYVMAWVWVEFASETDLTEEEIEALTSAEIDAAQERAAKEKRSLPPYSTK